jgi:hypothetical protein
MKLYAAYRATEDSLFPCKTIAFIDYARTHHIVNGVVKLRPKTGGGHNTGKSPFLHPCKAVRILNFHGTNPNTFYAIGEVVARMRNGRCTTIQKLRSLVHYEKTDTTEAHTKAEGWGFSPLKNDRNAAGIPVLVKVRVYVKDAQRFVFSFLKTRFCYLNGEELQRRTAPSPTEFEPVCLMVNDDHLYSDGQGGSSNPWTQGVDGVEENEDVAELLTAEWTDFFADQDENDEDEDGEETEGKSE